MRKFGWMDAEGNMLWPKDLEDRRKMARALFGMELVSNVDYWLLLADDQLDDTYKGPWAGVNKKLDSEKIHQREVLKTLNSDQRQAVRDLIRYAVKNELYSFCITLDRTLGGSTITVGSQIEGDTDDRLEIHSPRQEEMYREQLQWLEDFSILFGDDERFKPKT